ncbi:hypothetical protein G0Q06_06240 [Puniceicoccales bacterium CK1056]|uniref:Porin n=1 Tax=Oceanipulchritudo coccoides TaxID=2706888 RepID=A0A6B2M2W4_9BACT|nr:hypothetical protein [Oceanipulchritudo coccoides]NDV62040.1 hypothetical protein [Oceanipulchritudo coccoides]
MSLIRLLSLRSNFILAALALGTSPLLASGESTEDPLTDFAELEAFLDETDLFLEDANDPLLGLDEFAESPFFWSASIRAGAGHSSNFLKRGKAVSSPYLKAEADFFLNGIFTHSSFTTLLYFETAKFDQDAEVDREAIAFLHANWTEIRARHSYGIEVDAFYGDQIYDASLLEDSIDPTGASLEQFRPELSLFGEWDAGKFNSIKVTLSARRSLIVDEDEDYWRPGISLEWNRVWSGSFGSRTELSLYQEFYDDEVAKTSTGINRLPEEDLQINGVQIEEVLTWKPVQWEVLSTSMRFGAAREEDSNDDYDGLTRFWASANASLDLKATKFRVSGAWQKTRYTDRQVSSIDDRLVRQRYRTLRFDLERDLMWNLSFKASVQWNEFVSRVSDDSFSERRIQALLDWTY